MSKSCWLDVLEYNCYKHDNTFESLPKNTPIPFDYPSTEFRSVAWPTKVSHENISTVFEEINFYFLRGT